MGHYKRTSVIHGYVISTLIAICVIHTCFGYKAFQSNIPNGDRVPDPCRPGELWPGVGHRAPLGSGARNPFGLKFSAYLSWTDICPEDWDDDGRTNGDELGDPDCYWGQEDFLPDTDNLSHPGVCEPIESEFCRRKNSAAGLRTCPGEHEEAERCDQVTDHDTVSYDLRINSSTVPAVMTTYVCQIFDLPFTYNETFDLISGQSIIGNREVLHHMVLYGCDSNDERAQPSRGLFTCFMNDHTGCRSMIAAFAAWDPDVNSFCLPPSVGVRLGTRGFTRLMIQFHWTNIELTPGLKDDSGIRLFFTPRLRSYNSGMLMVGQTYLEIPPGQPRVTFSGGCTQDCSFHRINSPVNVIDLFHHMHYLGKEQSVEIWRNGRRVHLLSKETNYNYNMPKFFRYENPVELMPGDYIKTICTFDSTNTNRTTFFGQGTLDEMCFAFIRFYPLEYLPLSEGGCSEYKSVPLCKVFPPGRHSVDGCDVGKFFNPFDPDMKRMFKNVALNCRVFGKCLPECFAALQEVTSHPCLKNDIGDLMKSYFLTSTKEGLRFLAALNLCSLRNNTSIENVITINPDAVTSSRGACVHHFRGAMMSVSITIIMGLFSGILNMLVKKWH